MKRYLFLSICLVVFYSTVLAQRTKDSLVQENRRIVSQVDSLRKRALTQDTLLQSLHRMVELMGKDSSSKNAIGWRRSYDLEMEKFDSTLVRLDSCTGLLNASNEKLDAAIKKRKQPEK